MVYTQSVVFFDQLHLVITTFENANVKPFLKSKHDRLNKCHCFSFQLRKAYFRQLEEIKSLKQQLTLKDKRIRQLEEELKTNKNGCNGQADEHEQYSESSCWWTWTVLRMFMLMNMNRTEKVHADIVSVFYDHKQHFPRLPELEMGKYSSFLTSMKFQNYVEVQVNRRHWSN